MRSKTTTYILVACISILLIGLVSAGLGDWIKSTITGKATSQPTNVSVSLAGVNKAVIETVSDIPATNAVESSAIMLNFSVVVSDADGVDDINDTQINVTFTKSGETTRYNSSCKLLTDLDGTSANYSCSVEMFYWDGNGAWIVNVSAVDLGNLSYSVNDTTTFTINELKAMAISPPALTWPTLTTGATDQQSNNDPTVVNNTGNYDGAIDITGLDLIGESITSAVMNVSNFTADETDGQACASGSTLLNNTAVTITGTGSNPGNLSAGAGAGQEDIYYCIALVPDLPSQTYSTLNGGSWTVAY